uniref:Helitron_like_N domain-containing protein n=1 Tax=Strongyloides venezuelensis TaxID=75913 RepID=A0A0K0FD51_STRVS
MGRDKIYENMGRDYIASLSHLGGDNNDGKQLRRILANFIIHTFRSHFLGGTKEKNSKCIEDVKIYVGVNPSRLNRIDHFDIVRNFKEFKKIWRNVDFEAPHEEREEDYYIHSRNLQGDNINIEFRNLCFLTTGYDYDESESKPYSFWHRKPLRTQQRQEMLTRLVALFDIFCNLTEAMSKDPDYKDHGTAILTVRVGNCKFL